METQVRVIPESHVDLLGLATVANVATIGARGEPQVNPVWFEWDGELIRFGTDVGRQKQRNVERDPRVSMTIVDPANPYRYLEIRGTVRAIEPDADSAFINGLAKRYMGVDRFPGPPVERVVLVVEPLHTTQLG